MKCGSGGEEGEEVVRCWNSHPISSTTVPLTTVNNEEVGKQGSHLTITNHPFDLRPPSLQPLPFHAMRPPHRRLDLPLFSFTLVEPLEDASIVAIPRKIAEFATR